VRQGLNPGRIFLGKAMCLPLRLNPIERPAFLSDVRLKLTTYYYDVVHITTFYGRNLRIFVVS
jgi:hypothetical protein